MLMKCIVLHLSWFSLQWSTGEKKILEYKRGRFIILNTKLQGKHYELRTATTTGIVDWITVTTYSDHRKYDNIHMITIESGYSM